MADKIILVFGSKAVITFNCKNGKTATLVMKGNWVDTTADIIDESSGMVVARINRRLKSVKDFAKEVLAGQQTYTVTVAPGADMALVAAMCICMDEKNNEGGGGGILKVLG